MRLSPAALFSPDLLIRLRHVEPARKLVEGDLPAPVLVDLLEDAVDDVVREAVARRLAMPEGMCSAAMRRPAT